MDHSNISGTGTGTSHPAATDVAKESGKTVFGGTQLIDDPTNPHYVGHGVAHRDPKTGNPIDATIHIPTRGETHPTEFTVTKVSEAEKVTDKERLKSQFGIENPGKYHANWYKAKSIWNGLMGKMTSSRKHVEKAVKQRELANLETSAYEEEHGGYTFSKIT
ncbi:hypothetical protein J3B02_000638 [Coemansia erecta]|uniref:Uncharacterized protein n=1 Tax=Coemansia asiatica TaxID=1052880 RepID=A0A9W7XJA9_9FUNG|nr:hypothetical protein LPJ64_004243 [Coemansia asiatica]KAJ2857951.1 hypothetical protein J3B02_000638 [Coemansia erecta]